MTTSFLRLALLITLIPATGCVRHTVVQDFGLAGQNTRRPATAPDTSLRNIFARQVTGAFDPLSDDARIRTLRSRLKTNPADPNTRLELAAVYESYRYFADALEQYTAAFDLAESEKAVLGIARCDQALNRTWQAIPRLEQFLNASSSAVAWNTLGVLYDASWDFGSAERAFHAAVAADATSDQWHNNLGYNLLLQNKTDAAEIEFRAALDLNPKSITSRNNLGSVLARRGDLAGAFEEFQFGADAATAHNNLAVVLMELGKYDESRQQLVQALTLRRNFAPALSNFKMVQERMRQLTESQKTARIPQGSVRIASAEQQASELKQSKEER
jgi:tetratricopeptide (TPR) repeat protein